jgi:hypothetical protein
MNLFDIETWGCVCVVICVCVCASFEMQSFVPVFIGSAGTND